MPFSGWPQLSIHALNGALTPELLPFANRALPERALAPTDLAHLQYAALEVLDQILGYDFTGSSTEVEDKQTLVHVPKSWFILKEVSTVVTIFQAYAHSGGGAASTIALRCVNYLLAIDPSFFPDKAERLTLLKQIVVGLSEILESDLHFSEQANVHAFGNILSTLALHTKLLDLVKVPHFKAFLKKIEHFSGKTFFGFDIEQYDNCCYFILQFWGDIAKGLSAMPVSLFATSSPAPSIFGGSGTAAVTAASFGGAAAVAVAAAASAASPARAPVAPMKFFSPRVQASLFDHGGMDDGLGDAYVDIVPSCFDYLH